MEMPSIRQASTSGEAEETTNTLVNPIVHARPAVVISGLTAVIKEALDRPGGGEKFLNNKKQ